METFTRGQHDFSSVGMMHILQLQSVFFLTAVCEGPGAIHSDPILLFIGTMQQGRRKRGSIMFRSTRPEETWMSFSGPLLLISALSALCMAPFDFSGVLICPERNCLNSSDSLGEKVPLSNLVVAWAKGIQDSHDPKGQIFAQDTMRTFRAVTLRFRCRGLGMRFASVVRGETAEWYELNSARTCWEHIAYVHWKKKQHSWSINRAGDNLHFFYLHQFARLCLTYHSWILLAYHLYHHGTAIFSRRSRPPAPANHWVCCSLGISQQGTSSRKTQKSGGLSSLSPWLSSLSPCFMNIWYTNTRARVREPWKKHIHAHLSHPMILVIYIVIPRNETCYNPLLWTVAKSCTTKRMVETQTK